MNPLYAMDTAFGPGTRPVAQYPPRIRCEMLAELGFEAVYASVFGEPEEAVAWLAHEPTRHGLGVAGVYAVLETASPGAEASLDRARRTVAAMPAGVALELAIRNPGLAASDPAGDPGAVEAVAELADAVSAKGGRLGLYPHLGFWLERFDDALRLCERVARTDVGVIFCGYHWYATGAEVPASGLASARKKLFGVNLSGVVPAGEGFRIVPLDEGVMDNFAVLAALRRAGYDGPLGVQGYGVGGDVYANLARSIRALRSMRERLESHPEWAELAESRL